MSGKSLLYLWLYPGNFSDNEILMEITSNKCRAAANVDLSIKLLTITLYILQSS